MVYTNLEMYTLIMMLIIHNAIICFLIRKFMYTFLILHVARLFQMYYLLIRKIYIS